MKNQIRIFASSYGRGGTDTPERLQEKVNNFISSSEIEVVSIIQSNSDDCFILTVWYRRKY